MATFNIIVAVDEAGGFGKDGKIPWNVSEDMQHFKDVTKGAVCVMGRRTYEDILQMRGIDDLVPDDGFELLPGRDCYVVSSNENMVEIGVTRVAELNAVRQKYNNTDRDVFVIGGRRMFIQALSYKPTVYMTVIRGDTYNCDVSFPIESLSDYKILEGRITDQCYYVEYHPA